MKAVQFPPALTRIAVLVAFALMGALIGIMGAFTQAQRVIVTAFDVVLIVPWGMILMLVLLVVLTRLATVATQTRWGAWLFFTGWLAATILLAAESPSGDLAVSSGGRQLVYLFGGVIVSVAVATFPANFALKGRRGTRKLSPASISPDGGEID